jgi:hypothetical protein
MRKLTIITSQMCFLAMVTCTIGLLFLGTISRLTGWNSRRRVCRCFVWGVGALSLRSGQSSSRGGDEGHGGLFLERRLRGSGGTCLGILGCVVKVRDGGQQKLVDIPSLEVWGQPRRRLSLSTTAMQLEKGRWDGAMKSRAAVR